MKEEDDPPLRFVLPGDQRERGTERERREADGEGRRGTRGHSNLW